MAGTVFLSKVLDVSELESLSEDIKGKIESSFGNKEAEVDEFKAKYERLRVNSGKQYIFSVHPQHPPFSCMSLNL